MTSATADLRSIIQKWCPELVFHQKERYFCCTAEWFAERCRLIRHLEKGRDMPTIVPNSEISYERLDTVTSTRPNFDDNFRLVLEREESRSGQIESKLSDIPVYCHLKRVKLPGGDTLLEINYIFCLAYSGPYRVAGVRIGGHDGDWEHMTVRCTTEGRLVAVYYSAHRHGDGTWKAAKDCPVDEVSGRLLGFVSRFAHGVYPTTGLHARVFLVANDVTSNAGRRWGCRQCIVLPLQPGSGAAAEELTLEQLPEVSDRGAQHTEPLDGALQALPRPPASDQINDSPVAVEDVQVVVREAPWLWWKVRWGTSMPPREQFWYKAAEHPQGNSAFRRTVAPCIRA